MASRLAFGIFMVFTAFTGSESRRVKHKSVATKEMHFFMHDIVDLTNASSSTAVLVAGPNNNISSLAPFGSVMVIDDPLTVGPSPHSKILGRAKGTYMTDSTSSFGLFLTFTAVLKEGTMSFHGQDDVTKDVREIALVGGTGAYRFASGYAEIRTHKIIPPLSVVLSIKVLFK